MIAITTNRSIKVNPTRRQEYRKQFVENLTLLHASHRCRLVKWNLRHPNATRRFARWRSSMAEEDPNWTNHPCQPRRKKLSYTSRIPSSKTISHNKHLHVFSILCRLPPMANRMQFQSQQAIQTSAAPNRQAYARKFPRPQRSQKVSVKSKANIAVRRHRKTANSIN